MSDQKFPDGEFTRQAIGLTNSLKMQVENESQSKLSSGDYLSLLAEVVRALRGDR